LKITEKIKESVRKHSLDESPNECCGVILETDGHLLTKKCKNISENPAEHCVISRRELSDKTGDSNLFAIYHSHFDEKKLSWEDKAVSEKLKTNVLLYSIKYDYFDFHKPNGSIAPFEGRRWIWGIFSCIEIVEDYYKKFLDVEFTGHKELIFDIAPFLEKTDMMTVYFKSRKDDEEGRRFKKIVKKYKKNDIYLNFLKHNGFKEVKTLEKHDLILGKTWDDNWNKEFGINYGIHSMIYLGDGKILHHPWKLTSRIEKFDTKHKLSITNILRYEKAR
jgi:proteasome lid subunit RPN8/RPN11